MTFRWVAVSLRGPGQSPARPFACCVGSLRSVGLCGRCSCWCRFRVRGVPGLCWMWRDVPLGVSGAQWLPLPAPRRDVLEGLRAQRGFQERLQRRLAAVGAAVGRQVSGGHKPGGGPLGADGSDRRGCLSRQRGGPPKVKCGPATVLQRRPPSHGLRCLLSFMCDWPLKGPLAHCAAPHPPRAWARVVGLLGLGLYRQVTLHYGLSLGCGGHAVFHAGPRCTRGVFAAAGHTRPQS